MIEVFSQTPLLHGPAFQLSDHVPQNLDISGALSFPTFRAFFGMHHKNS